MDEWGSFYFSSGLDNRKRLERGLGGRWSLILFSHRVCRSWWIFGSSPFVCPFIASIPLYLSLFLCPLASFSSFGWRGPYRVWSGNKTTRAARDINLSFVFPCQRLEIGNVADCQVCSDGMVRIRSDTFLFLLYVHGYVSGK